MANRMLKKQKKRGQTQRDPTVKDCKTIHSCRFRPQRMPQCSRPMLSDTSQELFTARDNSQYCPQEIFVDQSSFHHSLCSCQQNEQTDETVLDCLEVLKQWKGNKMLS